eukprot:TRINITY_DN4214_c1_g1_i3.p1 TRINITY_DN4214_c1_g1~~TRINITY_DN4214_c1_g1_i3.p1  ORF type:complete len:373 (-),score=29.91 TRINITY_DN4214_c1_g1_i3:154-1272(-)
MFLDEGNTFNLLCSLFILSGLHHDGISTQKKNQYGGTAGTVLNGTVRIGIQADWNYPLSFLEQVYSRGIFAGIETRIFSWMSEKFGTLITPVYKVFPSVDELFQALENAEIDVTSLSVTPGAFYTNSKGTSVRRNTKFRQSCSAFSLNFLFVSPILFNINDVPSLNDYLQSHTGSKIGVTNRSKAIVNLTTTNYISVLYSDNVNLMKILDSSNELVAGMPDFLTSNNSSLLVFQNGNKTATPFPREKFNIFQADVLLPCVAYFRRDKVFPCNNHELEAYLDERCETEEGMSCINCFACKDKNQTKYGCKYKFQTWEIVITVLIPVGAIAFIVCYVVVVVYYVKSMLNRVVPLLFSFSTSFLYFSQTTLPEKG